MRRFLIAALASLFLLSSVPGASGQDEAVKKLAEATTRFYQAKVAAETFYNRELAKILATCDQIEVYLLDHETKETRSDYLGWETDLEEGEFPIMPYGAKSKILKRSRLTPEERKEFLPALTKILIADPADGPFCHFPIHGIRVFSGEKIIFQTSICWHCGNFYVHYPDGAHWNGIADGGDLAKVLHKLMPIPQEEKDRFEKASTPHKAGPTR